MSTTTSNTATMNAAGFRVEHTGGGCMAFRQDVTDGYLLITDQDAGIGSAAEERVWVAGRYLETGEEEGSVYTVDEMTLAEAREAAARLSRPVNGRDAIACAKCGSADVEGDEHGEEDPKCGACGHVIVGFGGAWF